MTIENSSKLSTLRIVVVVCAGCLCWFHVNSYLFQLVPYQLLPIFLPTRTLLFTNSYFTVNQLVPYYLPTRTLLFTNSYSTIYQLVFYCLPTRTLLFTNSYSTVYQLVPYYLPTRNLLFTNSYLHYFTHN